MGKSQKNKPTWNIIRYFVLVGLLIIMGLIVFKTRNYYSFLSFKFKKDIYAYDFFPQGETDPRQVLSIKFTEPVKLVSNDLFRITPKVDGSYAVTEDGKKIIFRPYSGLKPATNYEVVFNYNAVKPIGIREKKIKGESKKKFYTPYLRVVESRFFFTKDIISGKENGLVGEISFNYPVELNELRKYSSMSMYVRKAGSLFFSEEMEVPFTIEEANTDRSFYVKVKNIKRDNSKKIFIFKVNPGLLCKSCTEPLKDTYERKCDMDAKEDLQVLDVINWHTEGKTFIAIKFSKPVQASDVKGNVKVYRDPETHGIHFLYNSV